MNETADTKVSKARRKLIVWVSVAAVCWPILIVTSVWVKGQVGTPWRVLESTLAALSGAFGGVVLAAILLDPVKNWIKSSTDAERRKLQEHHWLEVDYLTREAFTAPCAE